MSHSFNAPSTLNRPEPSRGAELLANARHLGLPHLPDIKALDFHLPPELEANEPPEARGLSRDQVRLMVSYSSEGRINHTQFHDLPNFLNPGDVLVINTSGTLNAALNAIRADGTPLELHLSTRLPGDRWTVELRLLSEATTKPFYTATVGEVLTLPGGASARLHTPYRYGHTRLQEDNLTPGWPKSETPRDALAHGLQVNSLGALGPNSVTSTRLWIATLQLPCPWDIYLAEYGFPIRYGYVKKRWPISYYQTVYATEMGSAEMPSAGRAFTSELITQLVARGVQFAPLILHTGVASLEDHEPPYEEFYRVPLETARTVNRARAAGKPVVAVGTTAVRALETTTDAQGTVHPGEGWTGLVITSQRGVRAVDALLTGLHEPRSTHLAMLEALAGREHIQTAYAEALRDRYLWHEFGDLHLILP